MKLKRLFLMVLVLVFAGITQATNTLKVQNVEVTPGESVTLRIELDNETTNLMGWQCDIVLPEGLSLALKGNGKPAAILGERFSITEHTISSGQLANGTYRFIATSMDGEAIPGTTGTLFSMILQADASVTPGATLTGIVQNIEFNTQDNQKLTLADVSFLVTIPDNGKQKCATPTISYANGELTFNCETEGAVCQSTITDTDISSYSTNKVQLSVTYTISVYATKDGYNDSEVATATLCWIDVEPATEGLSDEDAVAEVKALPVLIQSQGGTISIQGAAEGTLIAVYDIEGKQYGTTIAEKGCATIATSLRPGSIAVVKIGEKPIKVLIK